MRVIINKEGKIILNIRLFCFCNKLYLKNMNMHFLCMTVQKYA